jgi:hypothetical protein
MPEHRFDGVMREVVPREERTLTAFLSLPRHRAVGASAAERRRAIGVLLDSNRDSCVRHDAASIPTGAAAYQSAVRQGERLSAAGFDFLLVDPPRSGA